LVSTTRRVAAIVFVVAVTALAAAGCLLRQDDSGPAPPDLASLDPDLVSLIAETRAAIRADATDPAGWARLGMVYEANGFIGLAATCYEQSVARRDTEARWWYRLALVRGRLGNIDGALAAAVRTSEIDPGYAPAHWRQGLWRLDRGELDAAERAFRRALEIDRADAASSTGLARVDLARQQPARAADTLEALLSARPGDRYALQLLGRAYSQLGRQDDAAFALAVAGGAEPNWRDPWSDEVAQYRRGYATLLKDATEHFQNGRFDEAIRLYERLRQRRDSPALATQLGAAYIAAGRIDAALAVLEPLVLASPDQADAHVALASAYLRKGNVERALAHADRALALDSSHARAHEARAMILWRTQQYDAALAAFDEVHRVNPRNAMALVWMGMVHGERGRHREALARFEQAAEQDPMLFDAWLGIARAQVELGSFEQAASALSRAELIDEAHPQVAAGWARLNELTRARPGRK
jgi:tetratricopeptide (TPR) repeat protein